MQRVEGAVFEELLAQGRVPEVLVRGQGDGALLQRARGGVGGVVGGSAVSELRELLVRVRFREQFGGGAFPDMVGRGGGGGSRLGGDERFSTGGGGGLGFLGELSDGGGGGGLGFLGELSPSEPEEGEPREG